MTVELSIHNQIFDQEHLEQFIQLLRDPDIRSDEMIRIQIQSAYFDLCSQTHEHIELNSTDDVDHLEYGIFKRTDVLQPPFNGVLQTFPEYIHDVFILKFYFTNPQKLVSDLWLFLGLNVNGIIYVAKELCWNKDDSKFFELRTLSFKFLAYLRAPRPTPVHCKQAS